MIYKSVKNTIQKWYLLLPILNSTTEFVVNVDPEICTTHLQCKSPRREY
jgi:hypothetical protein